MQVTQGGKCQWKKIPFDKKFPLSKRVKVVFYSLLDIKEDSEAFFPSYFGLAVRWKAIK